MARILIVDDEPGIRFLLERLLEEQGHEVVLVESGWSGLELFCRESPGDEDPEHEELVRASGWPTMLKRKIPCIA